MAFQENVQRAVICGNTLLSHKVQELEHTEVMTGCFVDGWHELIRIRRFDTELGRVEGGEYAAADGLVGGWFASHIPFLLGGVGASVFPFGF